MRLRNLVRFISLCLISISNTSSLETTSESGAAAPVTVPIEVCETSSLLSSNASIRDDLEGNVAHEDPSHHVDIRGLRLFVNTKFWFLFALMGLLSGIGLMTIK